VLDARHDVAVAAGPHARIITLAARTALRPLGLRQKGRSRLWIDDHGWWLVNVEFQPSSWRKGSYLNVGEQHLWCERDYFIFERHERPASGAAFIEFTNDETTFEAAMTRPGRGSGHRGCGPATGAWRRPRRAPIRCGHRRRLKRGCGVGPAR
jgi:hypothetical protein